MQCFLTVYFKTYYNRRLKNTSEYKFSAAFDSETTTIYSPIEIKTCSFWKQFKDKRQVIASALEPRIWQAQDIVQDITNPLFRPIKYILRFVLWPAILNKTRVEWVLTLQAVTRKGNISVVLCFLPLNSLLWLTIIENRNTRGHY